MKTKIRVIKESDTGANLEFDINGEVVSRAKLVREIENGKHPGYHTVIINGTKYPRSNPDGSTRNNLG